MVKEAAKIAGPSTAKGQRKGREAGSKGISWLVGTRFCFSFGCLSSLWSSEALHPFFP